MSLPVAALAGLFGWRLAAAWGRSRPAAFGLAAGVVVAWPPTAGLAVAAAAVAGARRRAARRTGSARSEADVTVLAELTLLGLSAGLTFAAALAAASRHVSSDLAGEVRQVLRRGRATGLTAALEQGAGGAVRLYRMAGRAVATGAPLLPAVAAFVDERRHADHAARLAAARRLPVRLLLPLALLILPGFVVLTAGPALLGAVDRLRI